MVPAYYKYLAQKFLIKIFEYLQLCPILAPFFKATFLILVINYLIFKNNFSIQVSAFAAQFQYQRDHRPDPRIKRRYQMEGSQDTKLAGKDLNVPGIEVEFTKLIRLAPQQHECLKQLASHYMNVYAEDVSLNWLLYKIIDDALSNPEARQPRCAILDALAKSQPAGRPVGRMFSDLETFLLMNNNEPIVEEGGV
jgi:hypothetical protein